MRKELHPELLESGAFQSAPPSKKSFNAGKDLFLNGFVSVAKAEPYEVHFMVHPPGKPEIEVRFLSLENGVSCHCSCQENSGAATLACEHIVASILEYNDYCEANNPVTWRTHLQKSIQPGVKSASNNHSAGGLEDRTAVGAFLLQSTSLYQKTGTPQFRVDQILLFAGADLAPEDILQDPERVPEWVRSGQVKMKVVDGQSIGKSPCWNWDETMRDTLQFLTLVSGGGYRMYFLQRDLNLLFSRFMSDQLLYLGTPREIQRLVNVDESNSRLALRIEDHPKEPGLVLKPQIHSGDQILELNDKSLLEPVCEDPGWYIAQNQLFRLDADPAILALWASKPEIEIAADEEKELLEWFIPRLADQYEITGSAIQWNSDPQPLTGKRLYLFEEGKELRVEPRWMYGEYEIAPRDLALGKVVMAPHPENHRYIQRIERDLNREAAWASGLKEHGLKNSLDYGIYALRAKVQPMDFLLVEVPKLIEEGFEIHGENDLEIFRVNRNSPTWHMNVSYGVDWLEIDSDVKYGDSTVSLSKILAALRKKQRFVQLADGSMGELPEEWVNKIRRVLDLGETDKDKLKLSKAHTILVSEMMEDEGVEGNADEEFFKYRDRIRDLHSIPEVEVPKSFKGKLFDYQHAGLNWLRFLHESDFSGLLADDMGVGKTIQTLCFLSSVKEENEEKDQPRTSLLVAPRSLVNNWQREAGKFAPDLKILPHWDATRTNDPEDFPDFAPEPSDDPEPTPTPTPRW